MAGWKTSSKTRRSWRNCERHWGFSRRPELTNNKKIFGSKKKGLTTYEKREHTTEDQPHSPAARPHDLRCRDRRGGGGEKNAFLRRRDGGFYGADRRGFAARPGPQVRAY